MSHGLHERSLDPVAALSRMQLHGQHERLQLKLESAGTELKTWTCHLVDHASRTAVGRGKGLGQQGMASAVAEALEHYWYTFENTDPLVNTVQFNFAAESALGSASPDFRLIFGDRTVAFDCLPFDGFGSGDAPLFFPAALQDPDYRSLRPAEQEVINRSKLYRYATNSGTAVGLTAEDAWLHGLLEAIERDAIGVALIRSVISRRPSPVRKVDLSTLNADTRNLLRLLEKEAGGCSVELWDITTDTAVPTVLCGLTVETSSGQYRYFGSGTSLIAGYAAERAMLESLQGFHIHQYLGDFEQAPIKSGSIEKMSLYRKCEMDAGYFGYRGGESVIDFSSIPTYAPMNIPEQISFLAQRLASIGCPPYRRIIHKSESIAVGQVVVPNLERFYLVAHGISVALSWRGRQQLNLAS